MNILVISSNLIGDSILSTGIIKYFIGKNPNSRLTIIVGPSAAQVYKNFPNVNKLIIINKEKYSLHWLKIWKKCIFFKWDMIIDFRSSLISYFLFRKKSYIYFKYSNDIHQIQQLTKFFNLEQIAYPIIYNNENEENIVKKKLLFNKKYIIIAPGGNWFPKIWPTENYNKLSQILLNDHKDAFIILVGSKNEKERFKKNLIKNVDEKRIIDIMGENISQTYSFIKRSNLFIGNDSGLMHLSAASNIPTIGLFGPTNDKLYAPFGDKCFVIRTKENYQDFNNIKIDKNKSYMHSIKVDDVFEFINNKKII